MDESIPRSKENIITTTVKTKGDRKSMELVLPSLLKTMNAITIIEMISPMDAHLSIWG